MQGKGEAESINEIDVLTRLADLETGLSLLEAKVEGMWKAQQNPIQPATSPQAIPPEEKREWFAVGIQVEPPTGYIAILSGSEQLRTKPTLMERLKDYRTQTLTKWDYYLFNISNGEKVE